ncbi:hypothetical protein AK812_SmicGene7814 [Symbiodinium microadriaticum]|uniref:Uncharacterized protein n=1 Tax=Symbiodinium microadriaticum TaxID=2951 RepID=A0A1Q9EMT7_SYMMI|nr:hypothetical protein AK812_SmicGene7814 [Symbiodinium microadriaticum]
MLRSARTLKDKNLQTQDVQAQEALALRLHYKMLQEIIWIIRFDKRAKGTKKAKRKAFAKPLVERLPRAPKTACLQAVEIEHMELWRVARPTSIVTSTRYCGALILEFGLVALRTNGGRTFGYPSAASAAGHLSPIVLQECLSAALFSDTRSWQVKSQNMTMPNGQKLCNTAVTRMKARVWRQPALLVPGRAESTFARSSDCYKHVLAPVTSPVRRACS